MKATQRKMSTRTLTLGAIFTALVILLQYLGTYTTFFGPFSTAVALIPIAIGAAMCGVGVGAWLGFVFSLVVFLTGGANLFFMFDIPGTIITVIVKGTACGLAAGAVYKLLSRFNTYIAAIASAAICPIVNTAVFLLGSALFFLDSADAIAAQVNIVDISGMDVFYVLAGGNFLFELGITTILSPIVVTVLNVGKSKAK